MTLPKTLGLAPSHEKPQSTCTSLTCLSHRYPVLCLQVIEIVCCRMTPLQLGLYTHFLHSKATLCLLSTQRSARILSAITSLRKLLNHPK